ncbi:hypothetical protein EMIT079MI2_50156 [Bacillus sp. IT-79MI2]|nr:hypothetical protein BTH41_05118 [Bacillus mycoides]
MSVGHLLFSIAATDMLENQNGYMAFYRFNFLFIPKVIM